MQTYWITRWSLTKGIIQADDCEETYIGSTVYVKRGNFGDKDYILEKLNQSAFATEAEAIDKAIAMARKRRVTLLKDAERLLDKIELWGDARQSAT